MSHLHTSLLVAALAAFVPVLTSEARAGSASELDEVMAAFTARTGARLVFARAEVPADAGFDVMLELGAARRLAAARLALGEAAKYPQGYLGAMGLRTIGIYAGLAARKGDGFRPWSERLGGYRYFGQWDGEQTIVAAYYSDEQLPLTLHHEVFHHVDATVDGARAPGHSSADDRRFTAAIAGDQRYPAAAISAQDLAALRQRSGGVVLEDVVSAYTAKSAGEDQAETARHLMAHLPDALVQVATRPELAGSQRLLHVLDQYAHATADGPDVAWLVDVALARASARGHSQRSFEDRVAANAAALRARLAPRDDDRVFAVWGSEDAQGVNHTLRGDIARFGGVARSLRRAAGDAGARVVLARGLTEDLRLLARYRRYIASRWSISPGTEQVFTTARDELVAAIKDGDPAAAQRLGQADWAALAELGEDPERDNPYLHKVEEEISDPALRLAIRRVQPAAVRLGGGSGVNLTRAGTILTAAHVVDAQGKRFVVEFPDGTAVQAVVVAIDHRLDLAVLAVEEGGGALPWAPLATSAPARGSTVVAIGQPGTRTPGGEPTGYQPWHVSVGQIRGTRGEPLGEQSLGGTKHDAWTYWGHSGSPLFDEHGRIVALHNSWDSSTAMRHAVRYEAIVHFLAAHDVAPGG